MEVRRALAGGEDWCPPASSADCPSRVAYGSPASARLDVAALAKSVVLLA